MKGMKSYANSYLYTKIPDYERTILEYVMKADRINKKSDSFSGIVADVKRRQSTAVLSRVLMMDSVVLCMYTKPLPAAFKVFACKDVKNDGKVKVFIDCTGIITTKNGYFTTAKTDILCTYLLSAMTNLLYSNEPMRLTMNSGVIQHGAECFSSLASHIFDYLRVNGYSENRSKIAYIMAMYYQVSILGLNRDDRSVQQTAAKVAGIGLNEIRAMELYYEDETLINIHTLITAIANTFKMKGIGTDVFIEKWTWFYGIGTQFATELFPAFSAMITDTFCGSYINNQKTIEKCCGRSIVMYTNSVIAIGTQCFDKGYRYESSLDRECADKNRSILAEELEKINNDKVVFNSIYDDIENLDSVFAAIASNKTDSTRISKDFYEIVKGSFDKTKTDCKGKEVEYNNIIKAVGEACSKYITVESIRQNVYDDATRSIIQFRLNGDCGYTHEQAEGIVDDCLALQKIYSSDPSDKEPIEEGFKDAIDGVKKDMDNMDKLKEQWKKATDHFVKHKWVYRYCTVEEEEKLKKWYDKMCKEDISYGEYKRYFKAICKFVGIPNDKVIIEDMVIEKDEKDKDQSKVSVRYSKGQVKIEIPEGHRLIHVSPAENIKELIPSFRSKMTGRFLYPTKRVFFTIAKEIKPSKASLEKTKTYKYTPIETPKYAYIDPTYADFGSGSIFVETDKPIPIQNFQSFLQRLFAK